LVIILFVESTAFSGESIVLQSVRIEPYDLSFDGFQQYSKKSIKRYILSEMGGTDPLKNLKKEKPSLIYAIGAASLKRVRDLNIPVIYSTIFSPEMILGNREIQGISMSLPRERIIAELGKRISGVKRVGYIKRGSEDVKAMQKASNKIGFKLVIGKAENSTEYIKSLKSIKNKIDILILSPGRALMSPAVLEYLFLTAMENKVMVVAFSRKYVAMGALISIEPDLLDVGKKAYQLAEKIKGRKKITKSSLYASKIRVTVNINVARILNFEPDTKFTRDAYIIK
jgi:putative ABC transport system substrate-binding protein